MQDLEWGGLENMVIIRALNKVQQLEGSQAISESHANITKDIGCIV